MNALAILVIRKFYAHKVGIIFWSPDHNFFLSHRNQKPKTLQVKWKMDIYKCPKSIFENTFGKQKIFVFPPFRKVEPKSSEGATEIISYTVQLTRIHYTIHILKLTRREKQRENIDLH